MQGCPQSTLVRSCAAQLLEKNRNEENLEVPIALQGGLESTALGTNYPRYEKMRWIKEELNWKKKKEGEKKRGEKKGIYIYIYIYELWNFSLFFPPFFFPLPIIYLVYIT